MCDTDYNLRDLVWPMDYSWNELGLSNILPMVSDKFGYSSTTVIGKSFWD